MSSLLPKLKLDFNDLNELHKCANDILLSPQIHQVLVDYHQQQDIMSNVRDISDASLKMLDLCVATRDYLLLVKDDFQQLQQTFRRAKMHGTHYAHAMHNRKKLKKDIAKCVKDIKGIRNECFTSDISLIDHSLIVVVHVLRVVRGATISILESLLSLIAFPRNITTVVIGVHPSLFASKFMRIKCKRMLERCDSMEVRMANKKVEEVKKTIEDLEVDLECIIRRLMRTRVLLLNILTS